MKSLLILVILLLNLLSTSVRAVCIEYTTEPGDTLKKISAKYLGTGAYWYFLYEQNNLRSTNIKPGQILKIYQPDEFDWVAGCTNMHAEYISQKLQHDFSVETTDIATAIVEALPAIEARFGSPTSQELYDMCLRAIATAEQESMFQFAIGGAGEIGQYQFKLDTIRLTLSRYKLSSDKTDRELVTMMLDNVKSASIFVLHYYELYKRYGNTWSAWKFYNNGADASAYASQVTRRYNVIRSILNPICR